MRLSDVESQAHGGRLNPSPLTVGGKALGVAGGGGPRPLRGLVPLDPSWALPPTVDLEIGMSKTKQKKRPYVVLPNGILVNTEIVEACNEDNVDIDVAFWSPYPWLFERYTRVAIAPLHEFVWWHFMNAVRPRHDDEVIHHKNHRKHDARINNLVALTRAQHAREHATHRQKFSRRRREDLRGFYVPRARRPTFEVSLDDPSLDGIRLRERERTASSSGVAPAASSSTAPVGTPASTSSPSSASPDSPAAGPAKSKDAEAVLAAELPRLRSEIDWLESSEKIPPPTSRPKQRDRLKSVDRIRRGCTEGEAALVRLLVKHNFDRDLAAAEVDLLRAALDRMMTTSAVTLAVRNWLCHRRLPPPSTSKTLRPYFRQR